MRVAAERVYLLPINTAATRWHQTSERLAGQGITGDRRLARLLGELEEELDGLWRARRRALAVAFARGLTKADLARHMLVNDPRDRAHIAPVC